MRAFGWICVGLGTPILGWSLLLALGWGFPAGLLGIVFGGGAAMFGALLLAIRRPNVLAERPSSPPRRGTSQGPLRIYAETAPRHEQDAPERSRIDPAMRGGCESEEDQKGHRTTGDKKGRRHEKS